MGPLKVTASRIYITICHFKMKINKGKRKREQTMLTLGKNEKRE